MWDPEAAPYPAGEELENTIINMKKEIKMSFLRDVFQTADEIKQSQEKFKDRYRDQRPHGKTPVY